MASNILRHATAIDISENRSIFRGISQSGTVRSQITSPLFYYVNVTGRPSYRDIYSEIQQDLRETRYGAVPVQAQLRAGGNADGTSGGVSFTWVDDESAWAPTGLTPYAVSGSGTGLRIGWRNSNGDGVANPNATSLRAGDWIQFSTSETDPGRYKVYQLATDAVSTTNNQVTVTLNTGLISDPAGATIIFGSSVEFNLLLTEIPGATTIPGQGGDPMYNWDGQFIFREVLNDSSLINR